MYKKIIIIAVICGFLECSQEITNRVYKKSEKRNVLEIITHISGIQSLITEYLNVHDNLEKKVTKDESFMTVIPHSQFIAAVGFNYIRLYSIKNSNLIHSITYNISQKVELLLPDPNAEQIYFFLKNGCFCTLNLKSKKIVRQVPINDFGGVFAISPCRTARAILSKLGHIEVGFSGDCEKAPVAIQLKPEFTRVTSLAFSPDGKKLAIGAHTRLNLGSIKIHDLETKKITNLPNSDLCNSEFNSIAFSPDGKYFAACGSTAKSIRIWNFNADNRVYISSEDADNIVGFTADNKYLITSLLNAHSIWSNTVYELEYGDEDSR